MFAATVLTQRTGALWMKRAGSRKWTAWEPLLLNSETFPNQPSKVHRKGSISPKSVQALTSLDPKSAKRQSSCQCLFVLLESSFAKAACKMLIKLTLSCDTLLVPNTCSLSENFERKIIILTLPSLDMIWYGYLKFFVYFNKLTF